MGSSRPPTFLRACLLYVCVRALAGWSGGSDDSCVCIHTCLYPHMFVWADELSKCAHVSLRVRVWSPLCVSPASRRASASVTVATSSWVRVGGWKLGEGGRHRDRRPTPSLRVHTFTCRPRSPPPLRKANQLSTCLIASKCAV